LDRITRKELKGDKFAEEVFDIFEWTSEHRTEVFRYGGILLAAIVIAAGVMFYLRSQADNREEALSQALRVEDSTVGDNPNPAGLHYRSQDEKDKAQTKTFAELASKYSGSLEGAYGSFALASDALGKGNLAEAEKRYREVAESGSKDYASIAKLALARVLAAEGKTADAQKILRDLINNPSLMVSKEQATLALAEVESKTTPADAIKLLDPLRTSPRMPVSRVAVADYGEISQASNVNKK